MSHPRDPEIGEYVLGTMPAADRAAFARDMAVDPALRAAVTGWEQILAPMGGAVAPSAPPAGIWDAIRGRLDEAPGRADAASADIVELAGLRASRNRWRVASCLGGALAASLAAFIVFSRPGEVPGAGNRFVAVVNRGGDLPALIIKVDARAGQILVRPLAVERPPQRSLELWYIAPGHSPRSLGTVDDPAGVMTIADKAPIQADATLAVTVEPSGGSPSKSPTGPVVYSGRLVPDDR